MGKAVTSQVDFVKVFDDGNLTTSTLGTKNADWSENVDVVFRVRFAIGETAGGAENQAFELYHDIDGGGYNLVTGTTGIKTATSSQAITDGDAVTTQRVGTGSFVNGEYSEDANTAAIALTSTETELEFCVELDSTHASIDNGAIVTLRVYFPVGVALDGYTNEPSITAIEAASASDSQEAYITGWDTALNSQQAYIAGTLAASASQQAYMAGASTGVNNQQSYISGGINVTDSQQAYVDSVAGAASSQQAYIAGDVDVASSQQAYIAGDVDVASSQQVYMLGDIKVDALFDNFDDNSQDTAKWDLGSSDSGNDNASVTTTETSQRLEIQPLDSTAGANYYGYKSDGLFSLENSAIFVEVVQAEEAAGANTQLILQNDPLNGLYSLKIEVENTNLVFSYNLGGSDSATSVTYNSTTHKWWRIRYDTVTPDIEWQTSPDGLSWTTRRTVAVSTLSGLDLDAMRAFLNAGTWTSVSSPIASIFDNLNYHPLVPRKEDWSAPINVVEHGVTEFVDSDFILWGAVTPSSIIKFNSVYLLYYIGSSYYAGAPDDTVAFRALHVASSLDGFTFTKYSGNPIIEYATDSLVEEGVSSGAAVNVSGTLHMYYSANRWTAPQTVDIDIRYRKSTDGFVYTDDSIILTVPGDEYTSHMVHHDGTNYHLYIRGPLAGGQGVVRRYSGTSPTSLSFQEIVLNEPLNGFHGSDQTYVSANDFIVHIDLRDITRSFGQHQVRVMNDTDYSAISDWMFQYTFGIYRKGALGNAIFYDSVNNLWYLYTLTIDGNENDGDIELRYFGDPIAVGTQPVYLAGTDTDLDSQQAYISGGIDASDNQEAYIVVAAGTSTSDSQQAYIYGAPGVVDSQQAYIDGDRNVGYVSILSPAGVSMAIRPAFVPKSGAAVSDSQEAYIAGSLDVDSNQEAYIAGSLDVSDSQQAYVVGVAGAADNQETYIAGQDTASDSKEAYVAGQDTASSSQEAYVAGGIDVSDSQQAYLVGRDTASDSQEAYIAGGLDVSDSQQAYVVGIAGAADNQETYIAGQDTASDSKEAYVAGQDTASSSQEAYVAGGIDVFNNQQAYINGTSAGTAVSDSQQAYISGSIDVSDNRQAYITGSIDTASNQQAYIAGLSTSLDSQEAYIEGFSTSTSSIEAYIASADTASDSQEAYLIGGIDITDNQQAYIAGGINVVDSQQAYIAGGINVIDSQQAYIAGISILTSSNVSAYMAVMTWFPFTYDFTGSDDDPWDIGKWTSSSG